MKERYIMHVDPHIGRNPSRLHESNNAMINQVHRGTSSD